MATLLHYLEPAGVHSRSCVHVGNKISSRDSMCAIANNVIRLNIGWIVCATKGIRFWRARQRVRWVGATVRVNIIRYVLNPGGSRRMPFISITLNHHSEENLITSIARVRRTFQPYYIIKPAGLDSANDVVSVWSSLWKLLEVVPTHSGLIVPQHLIVFLCKCYLLVMFGLI